LTSLRKAGGGGGRRRPEGGARLPGTLVHDSTGTMNPRPIAALLALSACSQKMPAPQDSGTPLNAVRVPLPESQPLPAAPAADGKPIWAGMPGGDSVRFGQPGTGPDLSIACRQGVLVVTRHVPAEVGAQALFALQGRHRIVRLAVDATAVPGSSGYLWQGSLPAGDPAADVFDGPFVGTLPDAGKISVPGSDLVRALIRRCGARPATGAAPAAAQAQE